jgi:multimeric flavodoxin WrbA
MLERVRSGATEPSIEGVEVVLRPALAGTALDALEADGYLLGTPANLGTISGALKHLIDTIYYPCLDATHGRPYGFYVHGNDDTAGAVRDLQRYVTGLGWRQAAEPVLVTGAPAKADLDACWDLGATLAAHLAS